MKDLRKAEQGWRLLDHTADLRIEVRGATLKELLLNAAVALARVLDPEPEIPPDRELDVFLEGDVGEELLVDWLREILFHSETGSFVLVGAEIVEFSGSVLKARLLGVTRPPGTRPAEEIKGVTYHGLAIEETEAGLVARIVFDI
jgi:SHS2 domain-containing protein